MPLLIHWETYFFFKIVDPKQCQIRQFLRSKFLFQLQGNLRSCLCCVGIFLVGTAVTLALHLEWICRVYERPRQHLLSMDCLWKGLVLMTMTIWNENSSSRQVRFLTSFKRAKCSLLFKTNFNRRLLRFYVIFQIFALGILNVINYRFFFVINPVSVVQIHT